MIVWVLINLNLLSMCSGQNTYYVSSTTDSACPSTPCLNFSQYIYNSETYFTSNTTLIFRPGDHVVETNVVIANVNTLKLLGSKFIDGLSTRILCTPPAGFAFENVSNAEFAALEFISCGAKDYPFSAVLLNMTDYFKLTNCTFLSSRNTALLTVSSTVVLTGNNFTNNSADSGGAIYAVSSNVYLQGKNTFAYNTVQIFGGAIAMVSHSTLNSLGNTAFLNNVAMTGGGVYTSDSTAIFIGVSSFIENFASDGSMLYIENGLLFFTGRQTFHINTAYIHGGILIRNAKMNMHGQSDFVNNTANITGGSAISGFGCVLSITGKTNFVSNTASSFGAVIVRKCFLSFKGNNTFHKNSGIAIGAVSIFNSSVIFEGSTCFTNNHAPNLSGNIVLAHSTVKFLGDVSFVGSTATNSGPAGIYASHGTILFDGKATFINNSGTIGAAACLVFVTVKFNGKSLFLDNKAENRGGALYIVNSHLFLTGDFLFTGNNAGNLGGAIAAANSSLTCTANGTFLNNSAIEGGGLSFELDSRFVFLLTVIIQFSNNTARRGGAIHVRDNVDSIECSSNFTTRIATSPPQCFFEVVINDTNGLDYKPMRFEGNTAIEEGNALYGGRLDKCELNQPFLNKYGNTSLSIFRMLSTFLANNSNTTSISSAPFYVCFCQKNKPNCNYQPLILSIRRGETFSITIAALDQASQTISTTIRSYILSSAENYTHLGRGNSLQQTGRSCTDLYYQVFSEDKSQELILYAEGLCRDIGVTRQSVYLTFLPCPVGFQLLHGECVCDQQLQTFTTECNIEDATVTRKSNFWMSPYYNENNTYIGFILHPHCPFDYCVMGPRNVSPSNPDSLCAHNRSGILCGACKQNFSLALGSSRCLKCENAYLSLIIPLALFGIGLVIFLFVLKLTVAIGTINGLIFYANVIAVNQSTFFPSEDTNILTIFIAWLNLDLGIETCFYDRMDTYGQVWLQFVFPAYVWMLVVLIILASHASQKLTKVFGTNPVSVLATLFLLSYAKFLRTIITVMSFTFLDYPDGSRVAVWLYDGNITYLTSKHIPLFITALIALLFFFLPYTFLLLLGQWLSPLSNVKGFSWLNNTKLKSFMDAYHAPYTAKCRYWTGLLLLVRLGLFLAFAFNALGESSANLLVITSTSLGLAMWYILVDSVYSSWYLNTLDCSFILNLGILSVATLYIGGTGGNQAAATYVSVSIAFIAFLGALLYHICLKLKGTKVWNRMCLHGQSKEESTEQNDSGPQTMIVSTTFIERPESTHSGIKSLTDTSTTVELREPLLGD